MTQYLFLAAPRRNVSDNFQLRSGETLSGSHVPVSVLIALGAKSLDEIWLPTIHGEKFEDIFDNLTARQLVSILSALHEGFDAMCLYYLGGEDCGVLMLNEYSAFAREVEKSMRREPVEMYLGVK